MADALIELRDRLRAFAAERDWEQFHAPKNLAMALAIEAAELMEPFQWMDAERSHDPDAQTREAIEEELADVLLYTIRLADRLGIDLETAAKRKIARNAEKYPVHLSKGSSVKYDRLRDERR